MQRRNLLKVPVIGSFTLVTVMVPQSKLCQNTVFYYHLYNEKDLTTM